MPARMEECRGLERFLRNVADGNPVWLSDPYSDPDVWATVTRHYWQNLNLTALDAAFNQVSPSETSLATKILIYVEILILSRFAELAQKVSIKLDPDSDELAELLGTMVVGYRCSAEECVRASNWRNSVPLFRSIQSCVESFAKEERVQDYMRQLWAAFGTVANHGEFIFSIDLPRPMPSL